MYMNMRDYPILHLETQIKVKEQLVIRNDIDVHEHERLPNITPRDTNLSKGTVLLLLLYVSQSQ